MPSFHRLKKEVGMAVLENYGHVCQECGGAKNLCIHHVQRMDTQSPDYQDIQNLTVLCRSCHMALHRKAGHVVPPPPPRGNKWGRRGKNVAPIYCKVSGCERPQHGRGLCKKHHQREMRLKQKTA